MCISPGAAGERRDNFMEGGMGEGDGRNGNVDVGLTSKKKIDRVDVCWLGEIRAKMRGAV